MARPFKLPVLFASLLVFLLPVAAEAQSPATGNVRAEREHVYVVRAGDSISTIASRLQVTTRALIERNYLTPPYRLRIGRRLRLPDGVPESVRRSLPFRDGSPAVAGTSSSASTSTSSSSSTSASTSSSHTPPAQVRGDDRERIYIVRPGDSISTIASRLQVSTRALIERNYLTPPYRLRIGRRLRLPEGVPLEVLRTLPYRDE